MRYWEIHEARMGKRDFAAVKSSEVLVGFEFEIAGVFFDKIDEDTAREEFERENEHAYSEDEWLSEVFKSPREMIEKFELKPLEPVTYGDWWEEYDGDEETRPTNFDDVKPGYVIAYNSIMSYDDFENWIQISRAFHNSAYMNMAYWEWVDEKKEKDFQQWYDLQPKEMEKTDVRDDIRDVLEYRTNLAIGDDSPDYSKWFITEDRSLKPAGAELVSPPMALQEAIEKLHHVLEAIYDPLYTNSSTGLHINISVPDPDNIDLLKLLLFMGEKHVLSVFGRSDNKYTRSIVNQAKELASTLKTGGDVQSIIDDMNGLLREKAGHYFSIDIEKLEQGYLEFRPAGGAGYEDKGKEIEDTVLRFVRCIELASDVQAERSSYLKKLHALVSPSNPWAAIGLRDMDNFRAILDSDPALTFDENRINVMDGLYGFMYFVNLMTVRGTPTPATQMIFRRILRHYSDDPRLKDFVKKSGQPWMEKLLK